MTKTKKTKENLNFIDTIRAPFHYKTFQNNYNKQAPLIYTIILTILITIISVLKNNIENYSNISNSAVILYNTIGLAILIFGLYTIFYIFINAYEQKSKSYIDGLLVSTTIFLPFLFLGNLLDYLSQIITSPQLAIITIFIIMIIIIYSIIAYILTIKNYYQTTIPKIIASMLQSFLLFIMLLMSSYITQLISTLN